MNLKKIILTTLAGIFIGGCANLPNTYRNKLTINSPAYKRAVQNCMDRTVYNEKNLEQRARLMYITYNSEEINSENFLIRTFPDKNNKIAYFKWKSKNPKEVLIYLNGLESHSGWFSVPAQELAKKGIVVYGLDRRGSGLNTRIKGNSKAWLKDINKIVEIAKKENSNCEVNLASFCFGARPATAYALQNQDEINSLIYISPSFNMKVWPNPLEITSIIVNALGLQTNTQSPIKKDSMFTKNPHYLQFLRNDKLRTRQPNSDVYLEGQKLLEKSIENLGKIKIPSLVLLAKKDEIVDTEKNKKTAEKLGTKPEIIEYVSEHAIFFSECSTIKFINDIEEFMLRR